MPMLTSRWRSEGKDPDYRFSLANERTFLAWIRTAMSIVAAAVALDQFAGHLGSPFAVTALAGVLSLLGALFSVLAYRRWRDNEIAMRHSRGLPATALLPLLAATLVVSSLIVMLLFLHRG
jgi:putative membrane protein